MPENPKAGTLPNPPTVYLKIQRLPRSWGLRPRIQGGLAPKRQTAAKRRGPRWKNCKHNWMRLLKTTIPIVSPEPSNSWNSTGPNL